MGYTTRNNGQIKDYWPDNTPDMIFLAFDTTYDELKETIYDHFGDDTDGLVLESVYIQTSCLAYDQYDPNDYTTFIVVRR